MGKEIVLFSSEEKQSLSYTSNFLRQLADKLDQGKVVLQQGQQEVNFEVPQNVILELKVEEEDKKQSTQKSLEVEIKWMLGEDFEGPVSLG